MGAKHPLLEIDGCKCTRCTRSNDGPDWAPVHKRGLDKSGTLESMCKWNVSLGVDSHRRQGVGYD